MFFFLRHAQTDYSAKGRIADREDILLNDAGIREAMLLRDKDPIRSLGITRAISSPLPRCKQTFDIIKGLNNIPVSFDEGLRERNFGSLAGRFKSKVDLDSSGQVIASPESGAETIEEVGNRTFAAIKDAMEKNPEDTFLFVGHGANFAGLMVGLLGKKGEMAKQAEPYVFEKKNGLWQCGLALEIKTAPIPFTHRPSLPSPLNP